MCYFSACYLRLSVHVPVSAFVLDPIFSHLLRDIASASLLPHHFFFFIGLFLSAIISPFFKKNKKSEKNLTHSLPPIPPFVFCLFVCVLGFFVGFLFPFAALFLKRVVYIAIAEFSPIILY